MLIGQLSISIVCFYYSYNSLAFITTNTAAYENTKAKILNMKCDSIDKELVLNVMENTAKDMEDYSRIYFSFGLFLAVTAGFSLISLLTLRKKYAANSPV
jgi:hypothetical protein